jgi:hypothetical protein
MKKVILFFTILYSLASFSNASPEGDSAAASGLLKEALGNMGRVTSYHALAELAARKHRRAGRPRAHIEGDFGTSLLAYGTLGFDGQQKEVIVIGRDVYTSSDGGKSWSKSTHQGAADLSQVITAPVNPHSKLEEQGEVRVLGTEQIAGTSTTHLRVEAVSPVDVWIIDDVRAGKVIRQIRLTITSDDGMDFDATIIYSDFNKPIEVKAPVISD